MRTLAQQIDADKATGFRPGVVVLPWLACLAVAAAVHFTVPLVVNDYWVNVLRRVGVFIMAAVSLNIVNGFTGQFSMGHAGFMALGAYVGAGFTYYGSLVIHGSVNDPAFATGGTLLMLAGVLAGALVAAGFGYLVGLPSLRLRGDYLAIVTLGFGEIIRVLLELTGQQPDARVLGAIGNLVHDGSPIAVKTLVMDGSSTAIMAAAKDPTDKDLLEQLTGLVTGADGQQLRAFWDHPGAALAHLPLNGPTGFFGTPAYANLFWIFFFAGVTCLVAYRVKMSSSGRAFLSIREDEIAARSMGVNLTRYKVRAFVLAAFFGGVAGALYAHTGVNPSPTDAGFARSFEVIILVVLGGLGSISGAVLAAIILTLLPEVLRDLAQYRLIIYALLLIGMMLLRPQGLFGVREVWDFFRKKGHTKPATAAAEGGRA